MVLTRSVEAKVTESKQKGRGKEEGGQNGRSTHPNATTTPPFSSMTDFLHPGQKRFSFKSAGSGAAVPSAPKVDIVAGLAGSAEIMSGAWGDGEERGYRLPTDCDLRRATLRDETARGDANQELGTGTDEEGEDEKDESVAFRNRCASRATSKMGAPPVTGHQLARRHHVISTMLQLLRCDRRPRHFSFGNMLARTPSSATSTPSSSSHRPTSYMSKQILSFTDCCSAGRP